MPSTLVAFLVLVFSEIKNSSVIDKLRNKLPHRLKMTMTTNKIGHKGINQDHRKFITLVMKIGISING